MILKGTNRKQFNFYILYTDYDDATITDFIDVGISPNNINTKEFFKAYLKNREVKVNLDRYKISLSDLKIQKVDFRSWKDNYDEIDSFYDYITDSYQGDIQAKEYLDENKKRVNNMKFKSDFMKKSFRIKEGAEEDKSLKAIEDLIELDWGKSEEDQNTALQLIKGLIYGNNKVADKFIQDLSDYTSKLKVEDFK